MDEAFIEFVKQNFRELKIRGSSRMRIGRRTYEWLLRQENKDRLDHLTVEKLESMAERHGLRKVTFDDGVAYIVRPEEERDIIVEFYERKELLEPRLLRARIHGDAPSRPEELTERYLVSAEAVRALAGDEAIEKIGEIVEFLDSIQIEKALDESLVRLSYDEENRILILACDEESEDAAIYPLRLDAPLSGTEVSIEDLDIGQRTAYSGSYRDTVADSSHDIEHMITKSED